MNKINFLTSLPLKKMAGKEKVTALIYFLVKGNFKNKTTIINIKKQWPKTQFKLCYNPSQIYLAQKEGWVESAQGNIQITQEGCDYILSLKNPAKKKKLKSSVSLFSVELTDKLKNDFRVELEDLEHNFGYSGACSAFLLRKILEKLIYLVFTKNNLGKHIEDKNKPGGLVGLDKMINLASMSKIKNKSILTSKTASELKGIKFLGDTSAHNPLTNVKMETIIPQLPYIITAYEELSFNL